jgi:AcrR family transcriptional regulator
MTQRRGRYAKGIAKREEILTTALDVIARNGYGRTSVKQLAATRIPDLAHITMEQYATFIRHNADVPGLVQLYTRLSGEATDPEHPAHAYFVERQLLIRSRFAEIIRDMQAEGTAPANLDPERTGTVLVALTDGLQTQWMLDPDLDMADHIAYLWQLITRQESQ